MNEIEISDKREIKIFKYKTFSNYSKSNVKKELLNNLINGSIEPSNYWCIELICSGNFLDIWEIIIHFMSRYIYTANPKLPIYIFKRFENFKEIINNGYKDNEINLRNNSKIRKLFAEIICILCLSIQSSRHTSFSYSEDVRSRC